MNWQRERDSWFAYSDRMVYPIQVFPNTTGGWEVCIAKSVTPAELSGQFSSLDTAKEAVERYCAKTKMTKGAKRRIIREEYEKRKADAAAAKSHGQV